MFVSIAAHELHDPIAAARVHLGVVRHELGVSRAGRRQRDAAPLRLSLASLGAELGRLSRLVSFMGDVARGTYGTEVIERTPIELGPIIREVAEAAARTSLAPPAIRVALDPALWVACEPAQIGRVVDNLVSNAIRYGRGKPIDISARRGRRWVIIRVKDRGIGVTRADRGRVFDLAARGTFARSYPGLGLGLWLARTIVEAHQGRVRLAGGAGGRGSVFEIRLPRASPTRTAPGAA